MREGKGSKFLIDKKGVLTLNSNRDVNARHYVGLFLFVCSAVEYIGE